MVDGRYVDAGKLGALKKVPVYQALDAASSGQGVAPPGSVAESAQGVKSNAQSYPVLSTPPCLLFNDLELEGGQSRTCRRFCGKGIN